MVSKKCSTWNNCDPKFGASLKRVARNESCGVQIDAEPEKADPSIALSRFAPSRSFVMTIRRCGCCTAEAVLHPSRRMTQGIPTTLRHSPLSSVLRPSKRLPQRASHKHSTKLTTTRARRPSRAASLAFPCYNSGGIVRGLRASPTHSKGAKDWGSRDLHPARIHRTTGPVESYNPLAVNGIWARSRALWES